MKTYVAVALDDRPGGNGEFTQRPVSNNLLFPVAWPSGAGSHIGIVQAIGHINIYENYDVSIHHVSCHLVNATNLDPIVSLVFHRGTTGAFIVPALNTLQGLTEIVETTVPNRETAYYDAEQSKGLRVHVVIKDGPVVDTTVRFRMDIKLAFTWIALDDQGMIPKAPPQIVQLCSAHQHSGTSAPGVSRTLALYSDGTLRLLTMDNTSGSSEWTNVDLT